MPIFEKDGKKYNVQEKHIEQFATEHPEATSIFEKDGKKYRVKAMDYGHFSGQVSTPYEHKNSVAPEPSTPSAPSRAEELMPKIEETPKEEKPKVRTQMTYSSPHFNPISYTSSTEKVEELPQTLTPEQQEAMKAQRQQLSDMTSSVQQSLDRRGAELDEIARQTPGAFVARGTAGSIAGFDAGRMYDAEYRDYAAAKESLDKAQDMINAADKEAEDREQGRTGFGGFWRGAGRGAKDAAFDWNTWSMGLKDTSEGHALLKALDAAEDGTLTPSQQTLLDAKAIELATAHAYESQLGRGYKAGKGVTESLPFMMEFAFNPIAGAGKTAANRMARYALNRFGKEAVKKNAGKYLATQAAANVGGDILKAGAMAATTGAGRTTADALRRMQGDIYYQPNEEGKVEYWKRENAKGAGEAFKKAYLNTTLENFSEFLGNYFAPIGKASSEGLVKGLNKIGLSKVNDFIDNVKASDIAKLVSDFENKAQWNGTIGEFAEEVSNGILNSIFVGDQTFDADENTGVFNRDNLIDTFIQTSLIGGGMSAAKTIGYPIAKYNEKRNYEQEKANFEDYFGTTDQPTFMWDGKEIPMGEALTSNDTRIVGGALRDILDSDDYTREHKETALKYAGAAKKYFGAEAITEKRKTDPETPIEQVNVEQSYEQGRNIATPEEKNDAKTNLDVAAEEMRRVFGLNTDEDIDEYIGNDIYGFVQQKRDENPDDGQVVLNYINAKAEMDGLYDRINDDIDAEVEQSNRIIDSRKSNDDGMIHPATLSVNDRKVYIISGNVARRDDGTIDTTNSTKDGIIVMDAETGKREFVTAKDFREVADAIDAEQEKATAAEVIANTIAEREEKEIDGALAFAPNDTYTILDNEGAEHNIVVVGDNGDGTINAIVDGNEKPQVMAKADVQAMSDNAKKARKTAEIEAKRASNKVVESSRNEVVTEPTANVEQAPERVVPMLQNGQPDFNAMDADMFVQEYASRYGEESTAKLARKNIDAARNGLLNINKKIDDITDPNKMQELHEKRKEIEARLKRYTDILDRMGMSEDANETEAEQKSKLRNESGNKIVSLFPDGLPNVESFILADIATGNRIRWSNKETNGAVTSRGLGAELGLSDSNSERVKRLALISNEAMTPEEYAESLRERLDAAGIRYDESSLRDDVLNVYQSVDTREGAWEALENIANRANEQEQEIRDWEDAQQRIAYEKAKNAVELPAVPDLATIEEEVPVETGVSFDENINEIENIFNDERSTENTDVPASVSAEDGIADGNQTGVEMVQGAGTDNTLGDRGSIEAGQGSNESNVGEGVADVPSADVFGAEEVDNGYNGRSLTSEPQKQDVEQKNDDHRIVFDAFGKDYISQDGKNSFRITQIDGVKRVANVNVNTEAVGADNLEMTFEEVANLFRNGQWTEATSTPQQVEGVDIVTIKKGKHTKTGEDLFVAKIKDRVSRDEYNLIKGVAKEHNGYYSTAKRGFIFKTESDAEAFRVATQVPSAQMEDAKEVSLSELREVGSATNDIVEPIPTSDAEPQWKYELTVYDNGSTILERSRVMPNGVPVYDANFDMRAANPREMLDILNNPSNNMQAVLEQVGSRLEQRATVWDFREKARTEGVNGYKIGDTVKYTYNGKQEVGTIYDFEDYGDHNPILDLGTAPVLYVSAQWDQVEKVNEQPTIEQPATVTPSGNKLVTDERYEELKRKMRQKLGGQMNMGIDPEILAIGTEMAVYHIEKGARKFADYASAMIADLGDMIRPYLKAFYNGARELPEVESAGYAAEMTTYDVVRTFDVSNFDKTAPNAMATAEIAIKEQEVSQQAEVAKDKIKNNRNKARKTQNKSVSSSKMMDLFGESIASQTKTTDNDLRRDDAVRTEGLPADGSGQPLGLRESERGDRQGVGQEGGRLDGEGERSGSVQARTLSSGLLENPKNTRNNHAGRGAVIAPSSVDARIEANVRAIELSQQLMANEQEATPEQMSVLRQFSGWGGLGKAFNDNSNSRRIQELLGAEAYQDAVMSANSAYYTPTYIVDTLWDIAKQLGFKGGNILEGSAGIGNILGQMPADISQRSDIRAIEIDSTAGNILSLLYPDAQVDIQGFEQTHIPNGSIDLAITNVPFVTGLRVNDTSGDKDLSKKFHNIHDFCIAKNVRKLREGGIGIFITSNGTLDNSKKLREWVTNQGGADFIGAFRLNNKTFGGTSVTSDIVVVRKRVNGQVSPNAIDVTDVSGERTAEYNTGETRKVKGVETPIIKSLAMDYNKYFIDRPENMAGVMRFGFEEGDSYRPTSKGLYPIAGKDQSQMLQEFVQSFTPEAFTARHENGIQEDIDIAQLLDGKKLGEVFVDADQLYIADADGVHLLDVNSNKVKGHTKVECFNAYAAIKDAVKDVLDYQTQNAGDDGLQPLLDKLNKAYDSFVKTYGHFNKNTAIAFLRNDVDYPNVFSLEKYEEIGDGKGGRIQKYEKSDVFKKRVIEKEVEPRPSNIKDGIVASIFKFGRVDVPYISAQLNQDDADVRAEIIKSGYGFENPATREVEVSFQYLSGNIREKLRQAEDNNDDGQYNGNIKALKDIMPLDIPAHLIDFTLGSSWINPQLYDQYVKDRTDIDVTFTSTGGTWFMDAPQWGLNKEKNRAMGVVSTMLHKTIMGHTLIEAAMQNKTITVSHTSKKWDGSTETITDKEATQACAAKIDEIRQDFKDWARQKMQSDPDMSAQMERVYNDTFNNYVPMSIPADFVPKYFGGASHKWEMRPHQGKAIVRGTMQPLLLAHEVGTGKTFTLISIAMEMRRLGTARKPMVVVQNATVGQFVESAKALYPNAKILTLEEGDRSADGRKNFYAKIKYNDWDMIVVPQSTFEFIPDSEERQMAYIQDKIDEKMIVLQQMKSADANGNSLITRQAEKEIDELETQLAILTNQSSQKRTAAEEKKRAIALQNAEVKAAEMLDRRTDDVENFDDMGIDALLIDEAHEYKHLGFATALQRGVKGVDPSYSKKSQGVYLKTQAVLEKNNGRNVIFATGTPISNTAAEIWTFMRYLMPADTMVDYGIYYFDDFVRNFGNIQQMLEFTTSGKFKESNRFAGYVNLPELIRIWSGVSDTVLTKEAEDVSDKIPEIEGGKAQDIYLPQTRALRSIMKFVKAQLEAFDKMSGKQKKENSHIPLTMYGIAKAAAVDARLVQADAEDDANSKTNEAVRQTLRSLNDTRDYRGTIAIFADNYQNKQSGFNIYEDIRAKLIDQGVSSNEIVVIKPGMTIKKKLEIFDKVNKGEIRVILGSTFTLGTGVNIQERLHTVIHLDAPNRPMDYTQRNGRILRQGNLHKDMNIPVRVLRFGVEDSLDVTAYQRLKTKGAIADSIMNGKQMMANSMINRVLEEEEDVFGDTVAQLSGSEYAMLKNNAEKNVRKYESRRKQWEADQTYIHNAKPRLERKIANADQSIKEQQDYLDDVQKEYKDGKFKSIVIGKNTFNSVDDMAEFFKEYNKTILDEQKQLKDGALSGSQTRLLPIKVDGYTFDVTTTIEKETNQSGGQLFSEVHRKMSYSCPELGLENIPVKQALLRNAIEDITENVITGKDNRENIEALESITKNNRAELKEMQAREGKPFEFDEELAKAKAQYVEYSELMKKEMEEKEAKYAEMDASVEVVQSLAEAEEDGEYRDRVVSYEQQFTDLQIEYDALYKNDAKALNEWREKKTGILQSYMNDVTEEFNLPVKESYVYDPTNEDDIKRIYDAYVAALDRRGITSPIEPYEEFNAELQELDAAYREDADIIVANRNSMDNSEQDVFEAIMHEQTHGVVSRMISARVLKNVWEEGKANLPKAAGMIEEKYKGEGEVVWGNEFLTYYLVRTLFSPRVRLKAEAYIKGESKITAENFVKHTQDLLPLTNDAVKQILNFYKDEYQKKTIHRFRSESSRDGEEVRGGIRRGTASNTGAERGGAERGIRGRVLESANALAASLGVKLNVVDAIPNAPKGVKGRYSISTDQVYFVLPNATSVEDAKRTVLHEVVAHKGLRDVVGRERFNKFLDKVFQATTLDVRSKIIELAKNNSWNVRVATEEYLASLVEKGFDGRENRTFWEKVRDLFMDMLREAKIILGFNINDNDMLYMLWRTYQMQRSNGIMAVAEDVVMQRKLGVGRFRSQDTNSLSRVTSLADMVSNVLYEYDNAEEGQYLTIEDVANRINEYINNYDGAESTTELENILANFEEAQDDSRRWGNRWDSDGSEQLEEALREYAASANTLFRVTPNEREQIIADAKADGTYLKAPNGKDTNLTPEQWVTVRTDAFKKWFGDWENDLANSSKVVDANGEPKVVYHRTPNKFTSFDVEKIGSSSDFGAFGNGFYFSPFVEQYRLYGKYKIAAYLNARNPFNLNEENVYDTKMAFGMSPEGQRGWTRTVSKEFTQWLKDNGYDAVVYKTDYNEEEDVVFNPNQIKSAEGNTTFDTNNDDIRYRVAPSTPSTGVARKEYDKAVRIKDKDNNVKKTENFWYRFLEGYQDSMISVKKLMDAVLKETGNKLRGSDDVYTAENHLSSKNKAEIEKWERDFMKPLQQEIFNLINKGASYDDIVEYLLAKHGLERNLLFSRREDEDNGKVWDGFVKRDYSGLTELTGETEMFTEAAQQIVDEFEKKYSTKSTEALWDKINAATKEALRKSYESSLMNKETYDKVSKMFKYYIPLRGWDSNVASDEYEYMANKGMKILPALKTAKGRTSRADDPIATLGSMGESSIIQGNRNQMKLKFLNFALSNPTSLLTVSEQWYEQNADGTWRPSNPEIPEEASADEVDALIKEHEAKMEALGDKATKKRQGLNINLHTTKWEQEEHAVNVKRNGKEYKIFVNGNPVAAQAINGFTNPDAKDGEMKKAAMWVKNFMARAFTSMNPAFIFANLARDLVWAGTSVAIKENASYTRLYSENISKAMTTAQLPRLVSKWKKGTLDMSNPIEKYFHEFVTNGGETGFTQLNTVDDYKRNMERFIKEAQGGVTAKAKKGWRWIWDNVEFLNRSAEDTTRFMVYLTSRQMGRPITESIANAKDITVNFNKKGRGGFGATYMNFAYIFFNATIQSLANFGKLIANHPKKTATALTVFGASGMIAPMTALALQAMLSGDDDEPTYWDLPEWVRRNNIVIYVGGSGYVTIPLPHELRPFYGMGELAFSTLMGKEEPDTALAKAAAGFASLMPFDYTGNAGNAAVNFTPTIAQPIAQLIVNKDYFGTPIYRKTAFNEQDPEWTKAYKSTNQLLEGATEFLNELTGGDEVKNGLIDLNPAIIEHLYEGYLGGMGKTINRAAKTLSMLWDEDARTWRNVPVVSSFYQVSDERTSGSQVNREYYDVLDEVERTEYLYRGYNKRAKMGSIEYAEKLNKLINSDVFKRYQKVNSYKKAITKLNEALKQADPTDREQIETRIMEMKVDMLEELEKLELNNK